VSADPNPTHTPAARVGFLGAPGHGKTALARTLAERCRRRYPDLVPPALESADSFSTPRRRYDPADPRDLAGDPAGVAVLVVAADTGLTRLTREQVRVARWLRVAHVLPFLSKVDRMGDRALLDLAEYEVRHLLHEHGYPADDIPVPAGSARAGEGHRALDELLDALDTLPLPPRPGPEERPFRMAVERAIAVETAWREPDYSRWTLEGRVECGQVRPGDWLDVVGGPQGPARWSEDERSGRDRAIASRQGPPPWHARVQRINRGAKASARVGEQVALLVRNQAEVLLDNGPWVAFRRGKAPVRVRFEAVLFLPGRPVEAPPWVFPAREWTMDFGHGLVTGRMTVLEGRQEVLAEPVLVYVELRWPAAGEVGTRFTTRPAGHGWPSDREAAGVVTAVLP
jgi:hypothetical protein